MPCNYDYCRVHLSKAASRTNYNKSHRVQYLVKYNASPWSRHWLYFPIWISKSKLL